MDRDNMLGVSIFGDETRRKIAGSAAARNRKK
jgi:hypothetical protein